MSSLYRHFTVTNSFDGSTTVLATTQPGPQIVPNLGYYDFDSSETSDGKPFTNTGRWVTNMSLARADAALLAGFAIEVVDVQGDTEILVQTIAGTGTMTGDNFSDTEGFLVPGGCVIKFSGDTVGSSEIEVSFGAFTVVQGRDYPWCGRR